MEIKKISIEEYFGALHVQIGEDEDVEVSGSILPPPPYLLSYKRGSWLSHVSSKTHGNDTMYVQHIFIYHTHTHTHIYIY